VNGFHVTVIPLRFKPLKILPLIGCEPTKLLLDTPSTRYSPQNERRRSLTEFQMDKESVQYVLGIVFVPLIVAFLTTFGTIYVNQSDLREKASELDSQLVKSAVDLYNRGTPSDRRFSVYLISSISDYKSREALRKFIVWDILERHFSSFAQSSSKVEATTQKTMVFDSEDPDWHLMGDAIGGWVNDSDPAGREQCNPFVSHARTTALGRWQSKSSVLSQLFDWLDDVYGSNSKLPELAPTPKATTEAADNQQQCS
jgi:hypothetical protein